MNKFIALLVEPIGSIRLKMVAKNVTKQLDKAVDDDWIIAGWIGIGCLLSLFFLSFVYALSSPKPVPPKRLVPNSKKKSMGDEVTRITMSSQGFTIGTVRDTILRGSEQV